jgi:hypothetical protein
MARRVSLPAAELKETVATAKAKVAKAESLAFAARQEAIGVDDEAHTSVH